MHEAPRAQLRRPGTGPKLRSASCWPSSRWWTSAAPTTALLDDDWTVVTADGSWAAHAEHTVAITDDGPEILTLP